MKIKRIISGLFLITIVAAVLILGNETAVNILVSAVAVLAINEFFNAVGKKYKVDRIIGTIFAIAIAFIGVIPKELLIFAFPMAILLLFLKVIITEMKINFEDIAISGFGIIYIIGFIIFIPLLFAELNGKYLIWYLAFASWGTDTFAYMIGSKFGKHKFTKISEKKSIEGAIGGIIGAIIVTLIYTYFINKYADLEISYLAVTGITFSLSVLSQIGDLSASTIKRFVGIKDFSNLIPGHGGMLDRIDSILFIAPFAYCLLILL